MDKIDLSFKIELNSIEKIRNVALADQKSVFEKAEEIVVKGILFAELFFEDNTSINKSLDFNVSLNKCKYHLKDIKFVLDDYVYNQNDDFCELNVTYKVEGEDVSLEKFCLLDNDELSNELRDYLNRNPTSLNQIDLEENKIVILDPVIEEEPIKVEVENERKNPNVIKDDLFKEKYSTTYMFYRMKDNESIDDVAKKFNIDKEVILQYNQNKDFKANSLIQIPHNV